MMPRYLQAFAGFYFWYFAFVGIASPHLPPYLASLGFSAWELGVLMSLQPASRLLAPYVWAAWADKTGAHYRLILFGSALSAAALLFFLLGETFIFAALALAWSQFFWAAILPLSEQKAQQYCRFGGDYSRLRAWGSYGFLLVSVASGVWIEAFGLAWTPILLFLSLFLMSASSYFLPKRNFVKKKKSNLTSAKMAASWRELWRKYEIRLLFFCVFCMGLAHGPYYAFYSLALQNQDYSPTAIGQFWALGVLAEIVLFRVAHRLRARAEILLLWSLLAAALRFLLLAGFLQYFAVAVVAQLLHAGTFALHHLACQKLLLQYFPAAWQARAQALYTMFAFGLGGSLGTILAGALWDVGAALAAFLPSVLVCCLAACLLWRAQRT